MMIVSKRQERVWYNGRTLDALSAWKPQAHATAGPIIYMKELSVSFIVSEKRLLRTGHIAMMHLRLFFVPGSLSSPCMHFHVFTL